jgi:hypothetical protein
MREGQTTERDRTSLGGMMWLREGGRGAAEGGRRLRKRERKRKRERERKREKERERWLRA